MFVNTCQILNHSVVLQPTFQQYSGGYGSIFVLTSILDIENTQKTTYRNLPHWINLHLTTQHYCLDIVISPDGTLFNTVSSLSTLSLHLHPEPLLPLSGGHSRSPLQHGDWHVEPGLHPCRTLHRLSPLPGREWSGANSLHHGGVLHKYLTVHTCCTDVLSQLSLC